MRSLVVSRYVMGICPRRYLVSHGIDVTHSPRGLEIYESWSILILLLRGLESEGTRDMKLVSHGIADFAYSWRTRV